MTATSSPGVSHPWEFDAARLARTITGRRSELGLSTRQLAQRAELSQAYVVALERAREPGASRTPVPTVDVVARLAHALGLDPLALTARALRHRPRHVLMVRAERSGCALDDARAATREGEPDLWVWSASSGRPLSAADRCLDIDLRREGTGAYDPDRIAAALRRELAEHSTELSGRHLGLLFADTSVVMRSLDDPSVILRFEHRWADEVTAAAAGVGAHASWNVCLYEADAIAALADPVEAAIDLVRSHDEVWFTRRSSVVTGTAAVTATLTRLRPGDQSPQAWRSQVRQIMGDLGLVA